MVERWSSKPYVWVRFLLLLFIFNLNPLYKNKNKNISNEKIKHFNFLNFRKTSFQQSSLLSKKTINSGTIKFRNFLRYVNKNLLVKTLKSKPVNLKKNQQTSPKQINYNSLQVVLKTNLLQNFQLLNVFSKRLLLKNFLTGLNLPFNNYLRGVNFSKHQFLLTTHNILSINSFQVVKAVTHTKILPYLPIKSNTSLKPY